MQYKGFEINIEPTDKVVRFDEKGNTKLQSGFIITIYSEQMEITEKFSVCKGFELMNNTADEALEFAQDLIECEMKAFRDFKEEENSCE